MTRRRRTRRPALGPLLVAASTATLVAACGQGEGRAGETNPQRLDERIAPLLEPCVQGQFYDRDTSDLVPVMIDKLQNGQAEPLKRAKEELGAGGVEAAEALRRFFDRHYSELHGAPLLENALDAAALNPTLPAHDILVHALDHPMESVRHHALIGMISQHALPEDFELFLARLEGQETGTMRRSLARALFEADPARAEEEALSWIARRENLDLLSDVCPLIAEGVGERTPALCGEVFASMEEPLFASYVAAPAARAGNEEALAFLRNGQESEAPNLRLVAVRALTLSGLVEELVPTVRLDPDPQVRVLALEGVATAPGWSSARRDRVAVALEDPSPVVRAHALKLLCGLGDAEALARALAQLTSDSSLLQEALTALREPVTRDPGLARKAFQRLLERHAAEEHRPVQQRTATYKSMGLIPLTEAAAFLRQVGLEHEGEIIEGLRAHDWLMIQASNTGPEGRGELFRALETEEDPLRRLDLVNAIGMARDDAAREMLLSIVGGERTSPFELLLAASRLVKLGPARIVAPRLKRISYDVENVEARVGLQCLLWAWY